MVIGRPSARSAPVLLDHVDGDDAALPAADVERADVARRDAHGEEAVARHPFALHARHAGHVHGLVVRHALGRAVGEAAADAGVAHGGELSVGVLGAADVVRPVVHGGDTGAQGLGEAEPDAAVAVVAHHQRPEPRGDGEVAALGHVGPDVGAEQAGPEVPVGVDEARHADRAAGVDDLRTARIEPGADRDDGAVADADVARGEIAEARVHGEDGGPADHQVAARRQGGGGADRGVHPLGPGTADAGGGQRAERGRPLQHGAAIERAPPHVRPPQVSCDSAVAWATE
jgi:hypothetical protein